MKPYTALRIIFMGTPDFAVASLKKLHEAGCNIVGVITAPDKPSGRGLQLQESPVKKYAVEHDLHLLQPEKLKNPEFLSELKKLEADLQVVVAFRMLPEVVWNMPPMGTINVHGSLLPQYRGAAPVNWAVINGEKITGITIFRLKHEIDTGDIIDQESVNIGDDETAGELYDRLKETGAVLLFQSIKKIAEGTANPIPQPSMEGIQLKQAPKIHPATCEINWTRSTADVYNFIRGLAPVPAAYTTVNGKKLKIFKAEKIMNSPSSPGYINTDQKKYVKISCEDGWIGLLEVQLEGKKKMPVEDFLRGFHFTK